MKPRLRILVVDDSVVYRRILTLAFEGHPRIEVAGIAPTGEIALKKIPHLKPDLILMDIAMPGLGGPGTFRRLREIAPDLPVIVLSSMSPAGAKEALDVLDLGAVDFAVKPRGTGSVREGLEAVRNELEPKILAICGGMEPPVRAVPPAERFEPPRRPGAGWRPRIVVVAASTGGPVALKTFLAGFPSEFPLPMLVVQHMPKVLTRQFAERLDAGCTLSVSEARSGERPQPGHVYIAPGGRHLQVARDDSGPFLALHEGPPENYCRPSADVLFRSAVYTYERAVLGVVFTGMGADGMRGCGWIRERGGAIVVQDEATSVVWGMPGQVARAGMADAVLPVDEIAGAVLRIVHGARLDSLGSPGHN